MKTIWKATLKIVDVQTVDLPRDANVIAAAEQNRQLCIWFECSDDSPPESRKFFIVGTGHSRPDVPGGLRHISTVVISPFVWHVYEPAPSRPACGHSACRQNWIDTGTTDCVEGRP